MKLLVVALAVVAATPAVAPQAFSAAVDASMIVLDHGQDAGGERSATTSEDDAYYAQLKVPDDLVW